MLADFVHWLKRFRTWVFNIIAALVVVLPDLVSALAGHDWSGIVPPRYMPYMTAAIIVINVLMRPRPAVVKVKEKAGD